MSVDGSIIVITFLVFILIWANYRYKNGFWKWVDNIVYYIDDYYRRAFYMEPTCFPVTEFTKYTKTQDDCNPCVPVTCSSNNSSCPNQVFNINCNTNEKLASSCSPTSKCVCDTEVIFGCYKYVLDKLPGIIFKFKLDCKGCVDYGSKETINHSLGRLIRIYVSNGNLIVEDSYSIEHTATVDTSNGNLSF